jgi:hypothetical protein
MKARYLKAFFVSLPAGAVIGLAFAFATRAFRWNFFEWLEAVPADAIVWAFGWRIPCRGCRLSGASVTSKLRRYQLLLQDRNRN